MRIFVPLAVMAVSLSSMAGAASLTSQIVNDLQQRGFTGIEVRESARQTKVEAVLNGRKIEAVYDNATGRILKQEWGRDDNSHAHSEVRIRKEDRDFVRGDRSHSDDDSVSGSDDPRESLFDDHSNGRYHDENDDDRSAGTGSSDDGNGRGGHDDDSNDDNGRNHDSNDDNGHDDNGHDDSGHDDSDHDDNGHDDDGHDDDDHDD